MLVIGPGGADPEEVKRFFEEPPSDAYERLTPRQIRIVNAVHKGEKNARF